MWKKLVADYFTFTRKERMGVMVLLFVILAVSIIPYCFPPEEDAVDEVAWKKFVEDASRLKPAAGATVPPAASRSSTETQPSVAAFLPADRGGAKARLFSFDPNTLPAAGWRTLGLRESTIKTIRNYLSKGGRFRSPDDLHKIYGLGKEQAEALQPYVRIAGSSQRNAFSKKTSVRAFTGDSVFRRGSPKQRIDINEADTAAWISLPGIGSRLAQRIVQFRTSLGGFCTVEQVAETFGLPDSVFQRIKPCLYEGYSGPVKKNVNTASTEDLKQHPYIRWQLANAIVQFRSQHGRFRSIGDLRRVALMDSLRFQKLEPYLIVE